MWPNQRIIGKKDRRLFMSNSILNEELGKVTDLLFERMPQAGADQQADAVRWDLAVKGASIALIVYPKLRVCMKRHSPYWLESELLSEKHIELAKYWLGPKESHLIDNIVRLDYEIRRVASSEGLVGHTILPSANRGTMTAFGGSEWNFRRILLELGLVVAAGAGLLSVSGGNYISIGA